MTDPAIERNLQRYLRGMTLTNYSTVGDVRAIRKCERANSQMTRTQDLMSRMYKSDLKSARLQVEFSQKIYAGQLMRIEGDRVRAQNQERSGVISLPDPISPRQKIVSRGTLKRVLDNLNEPAIVCNEVQKAVQQRNRRRAQVRMIPGP